MKKELSDCCNAEVRIEGDETRYYVCRKCELACGLMSWIVDLQSGINNQCDGCQAGFAINEKGIHAVPYPSGSMKCQKDKYISCSYSPEEYKDMPIGMYHCPDCGEMVLAGLLHPNYGELYADYEEEQNEENRLEETDICDF